MRSYRANTAILIALIVATLAPIGPTLAVGSPSPPPSTDPLLVDLSCGAALGTWIEVPNRPDSPDPAGSSRVAAWHNIPYAAPPIGELRWRPPTPVDCWPGTLNATSFGQICLQSPGIGSEDCLTLSVYVPERVLTSLRHSREHGLPAPSVPVLFYIHGGGLTGGSGNFEVLAPFVAHATNEEQNQSVISVVINYRLNIFGFLAIKEMALDTDLNGSYGSVPPISANFGLLDQQFALQWVQTNIPSFGGDPRRVTLAGQSSGGTSIFGLYSSKGSEGLFQGAIALSGSINTSMTIQQGFEQNEGITTTIGCANSTDPVEVMRCMRSASTSSLINAIPDCWGTPAMWGIADLGPSGRNYCGLIFIDGQTVHAGFDEALRVGLIDVPLMIGNMAQENDLAPVEDIYGQTQQQWYTLLNASIVDFNQPTMGADLYHLYESDSSDDPSKAYCSFNTDYGLTCGSVDLMVAAKVGAFTSPIYLYVNGWSPSTPVPLGLRSAHWAYHTFDWSAVCENWPDDWRPAASDWELSKLLQSIFFQFLINDGELDQSPVNWPSIEQADGFPHHVMTYVFNESISSSGPVLDYKADTCHVLTQYGLNQPNFWWCD